MKFPFFKIFKKKGSTKPAPPQLPTYHVPDWMAEIITLLIANGLASRLTNGEQKKNGWYEFTRVQKYERGNGSITWYEHSKVPTMVAWDKPYEDVYSFASRHFWQEVDGGELLHMAETYARERAGREELSVHRCIIQLLVAEAVSRIMKKGSTELITLNGDFGLIGRLPLGARLEVRGNIDTIEGATGSFLKIVGNVKKLGCGPFWSINPIAKGETGKLEIHGDVDGYKSSIENPNLDIEIFGSVTTKWQFLRGSHFRTMTIHKDVYADTPFAGLFQGDIVVLGQIVGKEWLEPVQWKNTSAYHYGRGNIWCKDKQLIKDGNIPGVLEKYRVPQQPIPRF